MPEPSPNAAANRNLLFGILALQADLISRDALINAMNAWAVHKDKPLGQILRDQGALSAEGHAVVETLVRLSLARHGDDAEKSLAALSALGPARQNLERIPDADVQASLAQLHTALSQDPDPDGTRATTVGRPTSSGQRFRILRPHAKGGLGEVFVAHDEELHREVALKEIQPRHADQPDNRARFLLEAEITGGLEHPGIVPVYGLGAYDDGLSTPCASSAATASRTPSRTSTGPTGRGATWASGRWRCAGCCGASSSVQCDRLCPCARGAASRPEAGQRHARQVGRDPGRRLGVGQGGRPVRMHNRHRGGHVTAIRM
jgi:hypothetical protein